MTVKLDWQVDEDEANDLDWDTPTTDAQPGAMPLPGNDGLERHPELLRLQIGSQLPDKRNAGRLYLLTSLALFGLFAAMCIFV